jgi:signal transduction histidine kinase
LAALKGHAQLLAERVSEPALAARIDRVVTEAVRLEHLTNDLLDFARSAEADLVPVDPQAVLERAVQATAPARIDRATDRGQGPSTWPLDAPRIEQVLINLLENALAVTPEAAMVEARVEREAETLVYTIRDRDPGVPTTERSRIFEPFHTTKLRGTGLGFSVARRIVELHRGRIEVRDARGGGAEFRVCLPRPGPGSPGAGHDRTNASPRASAGARVIPMSGAGAGEPIRARVLVVDDEEGIRTFLADALSEAGCGSRGRGPPTSRPGAPGGAGQ